MTKEEIKLKQDELLAIKDMNERIVYACKEFSEGRLPAKIFRWLYSICDSQNKLILVNNIYGKENDVRKSNMHRCPPIQLIEKEVVIPNSSEISLAVALLKYKLIEQFVINKDDNSKQKFRKLLMDPDSFFNINLQDVSTYEKSLQKRIIRDNAMRQFFEEISGDTSELGIWGNTTIGVELEFVGLDINTTKKFILAAQKNFPYFCSNMFSRYASKGDCSLSDSSGAGGTEVVSPILYDSENNWKELSNICSFIKLLGGKTNKTCGGHIHIGANILGVDSKAWDTFLEIWREIEPLMYMITNRKGEQVRKGVNEFARPVSQKIDDILEKGTISIKSKQDITRLSQEFNTRYQSVNFNNLDVGQKDTIEFRLANGSVDYEIIRENIRLYVGMLQFAKTHSLVPQFKQTEYKAFFETDIGEEEKLERFLDLIFDDDNVKDTYRKRWKHMAGVKENINFTDRRYKKYEKPLKEQLSEIAVAESGQEEVAHAMEIIVGSINDREVQERI